VQAFGVLLRRPDLFPPGRGLDASSLQPLEAAVVAEIEKRLAEAKAPGAGAAPGTPSEAVSLPPLLQTLANLAFVSKAAVAAGSGAAAMVGAAGVAGAGPVEGLRGVAAVQVLALHPDARTSSGNDWSSTPAQVRYRNDREDEGIRVPGWPTTLGFADTSSSFRNEYRRELDEAARVLPSHSSKWSTLVGNSTGYITGRDVRSKPADTRREMEAIWELSNPGVVRDQSPGLVEIPAETHLDYYDVLYHDVCLIVEPAITEAWMRWARARRAARDGGGVDPGPDEPERPQPCRLMKTFKPRVGGRRPGRYPLSYVSPVTGRSERIEAEGLSGREPRGHLYLSHPAACTPHLSVPVTTLSMPRAAFARADPSLCSAATTFATPLLLDLAASTSLPDVATLPKSTPLFVRCGAHSPDVGPWLALLASAARPPAVVVWDAPPATTSALQRALETVEEPLRASTPLAAAGGAGSAAAKALPRVNPWSCIVATCTSTPWDTVARAVLSPPAAPAAPAGLPSQPLQMLPAVAAMTPLEELQWLRELACHVTGVAPLSPGAIARLWMETGKHDERETAHPMTNARLLALTPWKWEVTGMVGAELRFADECRLPSDTALEVSTHRGGWVGYLSNAGGPIIVDGATRYSTPIAGAVTTVKTPTCAMQVRPIRCTGGRAPGATASTDGWGVRVSVNLNLLPGPAAASWLACRLDAVSATAVALNGTTWMKGQDSDLLGYVEALARAVPKPAGSTLGTDALSLPVSAVVPPARGSPHHTTYASLTAFTPAQLQARWQLLRAVNQSCRRLLPILISQDAATSSAAGAGTAAGGSGAAGRGSASGGVGAGAAVAGADVSTVPLVVPMGLISHLILADLKQPHLTAALAASEGRSASGTVLQLSNIKAADSVGRPRGGGMEVEGSTCIFVQLFNALRNTSSEALRSYRDRDQRQVFKVKMEGEEAEDAGGVYRSTLSQMAEDVCSPYFNLFLATPNAVRKDGNAYMPNVGVVSHVGVAMFEFLGRMMGVSLRTNAMLPFDFAPLLWKLLAGEEVSLADLRSVDASTATRLWNLRHLESSEGWDRVPKAPVRTDAEFAAAFPDATFTVILHHGEEVELVAGGRELRVTRSNAAEYAALAERALLTQYDAAVEAIRRGLGNVVPLAGLVMFTGRELEVLVCGRPDIDVAVLRANTIYDGYTDSDPYIQMFWRVLASLTPAERQQYVRFCWGRSRLPNDWSRKHKISRRSGEDRQFPLAHACFFHLELPTFSSEAVLRKVSGGTGMVTAACVVRLQSIPPPPPPGCRLAQVLLYCLYEGIKGMGTY